MPAVTSGKILVSGTSGFIGAWVARTLLEKGYTVRGTVRSDAKGEYLKKLFASYGEGKFEYVIVKDIEAVSTLLIVSSATLTVRDRTAHSMKLSKASMVLNTLLHRSISTLKIHKVSTRAYDHLSSFARLIHP